MLLKRAMEGCLRLLTESEANAPEVTGELLVARPQVCDAPPPCLYSPSEVSGVGVALGYHQRPQLTAASFLEDSRGTAPCPEAQKFPALDANHRYLAVW